MLRTTFPDGTEQVFPPGTDWKVESRFGSVSDRVAVDAKGQPIFDRPEYREAPNVNMIVWGIDRETSQYKIGLIEEDRPHADNPLNPDSTDLVRFLQIPMGFKEKVLGLDLIEGFETGHRAAAREAAEETGAGVILDMCQPDYPWNNPAPSFVATWSELWFVRIDLGKLEEIRPDRNEPIFRADFYTIPELFEILRTGRNQNGAVIRGMQTESLLMIWFAYHPDALAQL